MHANDTNIKKFRFPQHAYLLIGDKNCWREVLETELKNFLKIENLTSSPDIWWQNYESFGIKEAHALIEREVRHGFGGQGRFFVLEISSITPEAQNALLKTFEEPAPDAHFFIIARTAEMFLPTLRSRLITLNHIPSNSKDYPWKMGECVIIREMEEKALKFLKLDLPDRLEFIQKEFLKNKDRPKSEIIDFVIELEKTLRAKINMSQITKDQELALHELEKCQRYLQNPRSSNRLILEHLSLIIPN
ncbi:MAG: hypothetical protein WC385_00345 [Candidatus Paceibacterota bacterium]|jgi:DNA polymerase III delta prime subunit